MCQLLLVQLRENEVSYQNSEINDPRKIVLATSLQSFKAIDLKMASQSASFYEIFDVRIWFTKSSPAFAVRPHYICAARHE